VLEAVEQRGGVEERDGGYAERHRVKSTRGSGRILAWAEIGREVQWPRKGKALTQSTRSENAMYARKAKAEADLDRRIFWT
jgi:hypothetical protein